MFQITCPHCGPRNITEFRYGGETLTRPDGSDQPAWQHYLYARQNNAGLQEGWWVHRAGCQVWFKYTRDTTT